jgi:hypothetical protein
MKAGHIAKLPQVLSDLHVFVEQEMIIRKGHDRFCDLFFGPDQPNKLEAESFGVRGTRDVSTYSIHVEPLH